MSLLFTLIFSVEFIGLSFFYLMPLIERYEDRAWWPFFAVGLVMINSATMVFLAICLVTALESAP